MSGVDYGHEHVARHYHAARALGPDLLAGWGDAVRRFVRPRPDGCRVLDLGAGTGFFARAWPGWLTVEPLEVIAVEPSAAMRQTFMADGLPPGVRLLGGEGEHLPLRARAVDVAWLSAVVHHLSDVDAAARELRRVLRDGGLVLIRGLFADRSPPPGLPLLPGWERAVAAFPTTTGVAGAFEGAGFALVGEAAVADHGSQTIGDAAAWVRGMRHADSLLIRLTDDEIDAGLVALDALDPATPLPPMALTLLALEAR